MNVSYTMIVILYISFSLVLSLHLIFSAFDPALGVSDCGYGLSIIVIVGWKSPCSFLVIAGKELMRSSLQTIFPIKQPAGHFNTKSLGKVSCTA